MSPEKRLTSHNEAFGREYYEDIAEGYKFNIGRQRLMQEYFDFLSKKVEKLNRLLDVGCAYGYFLRICEKEHVPETFGVEVSSYALEMAKNMTKAKLYNVDISNQSAPFPNNYFDVVTAFAVIEHVKDDANFLKEIYRVLRKGGICLLVTPNGGFWLRWALKKGEDPSHINVHDALYWRRRLRAAGFNHLEVKYCFMHGFPPFESIRAKFEKYNLASHKLVFFPLSALAERLFIFSTK